ncbi:MAG: sugar isomerase domain-containing protein [Acidimicrobiia bacterium]
MSAEEWGAAMRRHLAEAEERNARTLEVVSVRVLETVVEDGLVFTAGTGHSLAMVLETFYRAGGLACVYPLYHPALLPFEGGRDSTLLERTEGLAEALVAGTGVSGRDVAFVFSNSGVNPVPVELAEALGEAGATVMAVVSVPHMDQATARAGRKLGEVADHVLDTRVSYGDASYPVGDGTTAPLSSLTGVYLWNLLLARVADLAGEAGVELPLWASTNVAGGDEWNRALFDRFRARIPVL